MISVALELKTDENDVMISGIVARSDKWNLHVKGMKVNEHLQSLCNENNLNFIDNTNLDARLHLNNSHLHLNQRGTNILGANFVTAIKM